MSDDTIFALATPYARSGVAIVRVSGKGAAQALKELAGIDRPEPNRAILATLKSGGSIIDRALTLFFAAPKSFTGEDVAEFHIHGSLAVIGELLEALGKLPGFRLAEPGEFTRRAYLNGKMDLVEAEGLADLIDAETSEQKRQALRQMGGEASRAYDGLRARVVRALAHLEAYIDFPEEEIPESVLAELGQEISELKNTLQNMLADQGQGERLREGFHVVIMGAPNAGKSSLLNSLSGTEAAIVSTQAGTTRDIIEVRMDMGGFPVILTDTAGLRESKDEIEAEGVKRALARAKAADLKLLVVDAGVIMDKKMEEQIDSNTILVITKIDTYSSAKHHRALLVSAKTGEGMGALVKAIESRIASQFSGASPLITRARHRALLEAASQALNGYSAELPLELACEELRSAAQHIGKITGKIQVDELLDVIFRQFCIGK